MQRRTLLQAGMLGLSSLVVPRLVQACACGGSVQYINIDLSQMETAPDIEQLLNQAYGHDRWQWQQIPGLTIKTPEISENRDHTPVSIELDQLSDAYAELEKIDLYTEGSIEITHNAKQFNGYSNICLKIGSARLESIFPAVFKTRYRRPRGKSFLYAALTLKDINGTKHVLVHSYQSRTITAGCNTTIYVDPAY